MDIADWWTSLVSAAESSASAAIASAVAELQPGSIQGSTYELQLFNPQRERFVRGRLPDIEQLAQQITGQQTSIKLTVQSENQSTNSSESTPITENRQPDPDHAAAMNHPLVRRAVELFDARIVNIEPAEPPPNNHTPEDNT